MNDEPQRWCGDEHGRVQDGTPAIVLKDHMDPVVDLRSRALYGLARQHAIGQPE